MANEQITDGLSALKTILADLDPSPQPSPTAIYQFPEDFDTEAERAAVDYADLPLVVVLNQVNVWNMWRPATHGSIYHIWICDVLAFLAPEVISIRQEAEAKAKYVPWLAAMQTLLYTNVNQGLSGTALAIGNENYLFRYRVGNLGWIDTKVFWGVRFQFPVIQEHS